MKKEPPKSMRAPDVYDRVCAACCPYTGLSDEDYDLHRRAVTLRVLHVLGLLPRARRTA
jgi:hypothetical protein